MLVELISGYEEQELQKYINIKQQKIDLPRRPRSR
jgi:hypothetical protein